MISKFKHQTLRTHLRLHLKALLTRSASATATIDEKGAQSEHSWMAGDERMSQVGPFLVRDYSRGNACILDARALPDTVLAQHVYSQHARCKLFQQVNQASSSRAVRELIRSVMSLTTEMERSL